VWGSEEGLTAESAEGAEKEGAERGVNLRERGARRRRAQRGAGYLCE